MDSKLQILWAMLAVVSCSFLQTPSNQFQSTFNSTFLTGNERLFKPIFIPNITEKAKYSHGTKARVHETHKSKENEEILRKILHPQESTIRENYSEEMKTAGTPLKFSSRYSTKVENSSKEKKTLPEESVKLAEIEVSSETEASDSLERNEIEIPPSKSEEIQNKKRESFSDRSDDLGESGEEKEDSYGSPDSDESKDVGESAETETDGPHLDLPRPTSFRKYSDDDFENYETTSNAVEENDSSEEREKEEEDKRSIDDYYNSGSKNYHSIQTPLSQIKYRGSDSFKDDFESEKVRTKLLSPVDRRPDTHDWSRGKTELEKLNEISDADESFGKTPDEDAKEEVKIKPKHQGLESAVEKDEFKFDRNKKYNAIDERNYRKQQQKTLAEEENKDDRRPLFQSLKQYHVDEKEPNHQAEVNAKVEDISKFKINEEIWSTKSPYKNIFKVGPPKRRQPKKFNISNELTHNFQGHQFLGPVVFNHDSGTIKSQKETVRKAFVKGLSKNEKLDRDNFANLKFQKSIFETGSLETQGFNHLEESDEMYNAILAKIQSVFGLRVQPGKSGPGNSKGPSSKANSDESKSLMWSLPLIKREKIN